MFAQLLADVLPFVRVQLLVSERLRLTLATLLRIMAVALYEFLVKVGEGREDT